MSETSEKFARMLAIETATSTQAVALIDGDELLEHRVRKVVFNHGSSLLETIDQILEERTVELADIDLFCVGLGPGSFTGLRVGLATAKALSRAVDSPIVGVSSLAALAYGPARTAVGTTIAASIDARRHEVYAGAYRWKNGELITVVDECALSPEDWIDEVTDGVSGPLLQVGNASRRYDALAAWESSDMETISPQLVTVSAVGVALLGRFTAATAGPDDRHRLEPHYIRPSDAVLPEDEPEPMPPKPER